MYKLLFVYTSLPSYMLDCLNDLAENANYKITVVETSRNKNYPVHLSSTNISIIPYEEFCKNSLVLSIGNSLSFSVAFVSGWANKKIIHLTKKLSDAGVPLVLCSDQADKGGLKQMVGKFVLSRYLKRFKVALVPGFSAKELLIRYGFDASKIHIGLYSANDEHFGQSWDRRLALKEWPRVFLFDGQHIRRKGFDSLVTEYLDYRNFSKNPWQLITVGKGALSTIVPPEIDNRGFIQPYQLNKIYSNAGCFVLPSREDHWPLVLHQATCSGLPLLISRHCGNRFEFFDENSNGFFVDPDVKGSISAAMLKIEHYEGLPIMSNKSHLLASSYGLKKWSLNIRQIVCNVLE